MRKLISEVPLKVRFNEVDALRIVWHGHYVNYFEDGRQDFGRKFGLGYMDFFNEGYTVPIVEVLVQHKHPLTFGEEAIVKTTFVNTQAAKILFNYEIVHKDTSALICKGSTIQVFTKKDTMELELYPPDFFLEWKKKHGIS